MRFHFRRLRAIRLPFRKQLRAVAGDETLREVKKCTRPPHEGPCNGWPCDYVAEKLRHDKYPAK